MEELAVVFLEKGRFFDPAQGWRVSLPLFLREIDAACCQTNYHVFQA